MIKFAPKNAVSYEIEGLVENDIGICPFIIKGFGVDVSVSVVPTSLEFGVVGANTPVMRMLAVKNSLDLDIGVVITSSSNFVNLEVE